MSKREEHEVRDGVGAVELNLGQVAAEGYLKKLRASASGKYEMQRDDWSVVIDSAYVLKKYGLAETEGKRIVAAVVQVGRARALEILMEKKNG